MFVEKVTNYLIIQLKPNPVYSVSYIFDFVWTEFVYPYRMKKEVIHSEQLPTSS